MIAGVIFDYGGVLTTPVRESIDAWIEADGIVRESFTRTLRSWSEGDVADGSPVHRLETGVLTIAEFDALLAAELDTVHGGPVEPEGVLRRVFARMLPDPETFALIEDLRAAGVKVGMLSNSWGNTYPRERIDALFDAIVISGEVGMRKPDPAIYRLVLDRLDVAAESAVFIDDLAANLAGAEAVGMHTIQHRDAGSTRTALARLIPSLDPAGEIS